MIIEKFGIVDNVFTRQELDFLVSTMSRLKPVDRLGNHCHAIDETHTFRSWFEKYCFNKIRTLIGEDARFVFGMYLDENRPWRIHEDAYHARQFENYQPYLSVVLPYSVDKDPELCNKVRTIIFNESYLDVGGDNWIDKIIDYPIPQDNAGQIFEQHLSHNDPEVVKRLTVGKNAQWNLGSLIYWESNLLHDSDNFNKNGYNSKQAIVIQTYKLKA